MLWGDAANKVFADAVVVRSPDNFNWTFIAILAFVFYIYWTEIKNKNWKVIQAGLALYGVHWFYEIVNAIICYCSGYALWTVSNESTSFVLLIGVSWELSMMFSVAGMVSFKMLPDDRNSKLLGLPCKWTGAISMSIMFSLFEIFLAWTPAFIWVYKWWGAIPVCITTYMPFFIAANFVPDASPKFKKIFLIGLWGLDAVLLAVLIPLGII